VTIVRSYKSIALAVFFCISAVSAHAQSDLTGKWTGQFVGVQIEMPAERGPFGQVRDDSKAPSPRFVDNALQLVIETQNKGLIVGTWAAEDYKKRFVCAQTASTAWNCIDSGGRATLDVTSPTEIKVCYFDNREGAQGAGCASLRRAK
jgi:hypothetical protein